MKPTLRGHTKVFRKGLDIWMYFSEPAEDTERVAEDKEEVDDLVGQGGHHEELAPKLQRGSRGVCKHFNERTQHEDNGPQPLDPLQPRGGISVMKLMR